MIIYISRSQWPRDLRRRSMAPRLLRSWVQIPPGAWIFFCCVCYVLSGRGLCDELITRPRTVLPTAARYCVWSRNLVWRGGHSLRWAAEPEKIINNMLCYIIYIHSSKSNLIICYIQFNTKTLTCLERVCHMCSAEHAMAETERKIPVITSTLRWILPNAFQNNVTK
jgi:hypothetical protein